VRLIDGLLYGEGQCSSRKDSALAQDLLLALCMNMSCQGKVCAECFLSVSNEDTIQQVVEVFNHIREVRK